MKRKNTYFQLSILDLDSYKYLDSYRLLYQGTATFQFNSNQNYFIHS